MFSKDGLHVNGVEIPAWYSPPFNYPKNARFTQDTKVQAVKVQQERGPEVAGVASERYKRNDWADYDDWMQERAQIAVDYKDRTTSFITYVPYIPHLAGAAPCVNLIDL